MSTAVAGVPAQTAPARPLVWRALDTVRDPELDEPVTDLGFVASCEVSADGAVEVHLRLPTYFCAPNFAYLMVADAYEAVVAVPGATSVTVLLDDHFASEEINAGVAARAGFADTFGRDVAGEVDTLRAMFVKKAVLAGTDRVCRPLIGAGTTYDELAAMTLGDAPPSVDLDRLRARRTELGLPASADSALLIDVETGAAVVPDALKMHLGRARLTRVNIEANSGVCRGMLAGRYGVTTPVGAGVTTPVGAGVTTPVGAGVTTPVGAGVTTPVGAGVTIGEGEDE